MPWALKTQNTTQTHTTPLSNLPKTQPWGPTAKPHQKSNRRTKTSTTSPDRPNINITIFSKKNMRDYKHQVFANLWSFRQINPIVPYLPFRKAKAFIDNSQNQSSKSTCRERQLRSRTLTLFSKSDRAPHNSMLHDCRIAAGMLELTIIAGSPLSDVAIVFAGGF